MTEITDGRQQQIVEWHGGKALLLAGPGCGKTHILARRVCHANTALGIPFGRMLCVTFTNRAAREMSARIRHYSGSRPEGLFVGTMHRFCLRFLFANRLIPADTVVLDEDARLSFLASVGIVSSRDVKDFLLMNAFVYQTECGHPEWLLRRLGRIPTDSDIKRIEAYNDFKATNSLIDFDDILLRSYTALTLPGADSFDMSGFSWVQVDEVQDMTPLQLGLIELLCKGPESTCLFLGDEQQSIFRFTGAGGPAINMLKHICSGNIFTLRRNYRSSHRLVDLCNNIATTWLGKPVTEQSDTVFRSDNEDIPLAYRASPANLRLMAASTVRRFKAEAPDESVMVLTRTNAEADDLAYIFSHLGIDAFHFSRKDVFNSVSFRTLWSHLAALINPLHIHAWPRLLYQTGATRTLEGAKSIVAKLLSVAIEPAALLAPSQPTALQRFCNAFDSGRTFVVIDTETTGLDVFSDDVVQLAAVRMTRGRVVSDDVFSVFIESKRRIPETLADGSENPLAKKYRQISATDPQQAFEAFLEWLGDELCVIAGHNIDFDKAIIANNIARRTTLSQPSQFKEPGVDSLLLSRLLLPHLHSHTLQFVASSLNIKHEDAHLADSDALACAEVLRALHNHAQLKISSTNSIWSNAKVTALAKKFDRYYGAFYRRSLASINKPGGNLANIIAEAADYFITTGAIEAIRQLPEIVRLVDDYVVDRSKCPDLRSQLYTYTPELPGYSEADLYTYGLIAKRTVIATIHKAKGLEADNVVVYEASCPGDHDDRARLLYVAFSRARRRLAVGFGGEADDILKSVLPHFHFLTLKEVAVAVNAEALNFDEI